MPVILIKLSSDHFPRHRLLLSLSQGICPLSFVYGWFATPVLYLHLDCLRSFHHIVHIIVLHFVYSSIYF